MTSLECKLEQGSAARGFRRPADIQPDTLLPQESLEHLDGRVEIPDGRRRGQCLIRLVVPTYPILLEIQDEVVDAG